MTHVPKAGTYRLVSPGLLRQLMERTGDGNAIGSRPLGRAVGISHGTVSNLLTGQTETVSAEVAQRMAARLGVDTLVLWSPVERTEVAKLSTSRPRHLASA